MGIVQVAVSIYPIYVVSLFYICSIQNADDIIDRQSIMLGF